MQAEINAPLQALLQTAEMVTPDQQSPTVAAKVAEAAQQKMQAAMPPGMRPGMPPSTPPGIGALLPGVQQQAMMAAQAAQPATQGDVNQIRQMMAQAQQAQQMQQGPRMGAGVAALPGADVRMAEGGVVGYAGPDGSYVDNAEAQALDELRIKETERRVRERIAEAERQRQIAELQRQAVFLEQAGAPQAAQVRAEIARLENAPTAAPQSVPQQPVTPPVVAQAQPSPQVRPQQRPPMQQAPVRQAPVQQAPAAPMLPDTRESTAVNPSEAALQYAQLQGMIKALGERMGQKPQESEAEKAYRTAAMAEYQRGLGSIEAARQRMAASQQKQSQQDLINYLSGIGGSGSLFEGMRRSGQALSQTQQQREATRLAYEDKLEDRRNIVENLKLATLRQDAESARAWTNELRKNEVEIAKLNIGLGERRAGELARAELSREEMGARAMEGAANRANAIELERMRRATADRPGETERILAEFNRLKARDPAAAEAYLQNVERIKGLGRTNRTVMTYDQAADNVSKFLETPAGMMEISSIRKRAKDAGQPEPSLMQIREALIQRELQGAGGQTATTPTGGAVRPTSKAEFDALPKGARYINPADGKEYIKN